MSEASCWPELALAQALLFAGLRAVKYREAPAMRPAVPGDLGAALLGGGLLCALAGLHPVFAAAAVVLATALFFALWLDAALYRLFNVELGAGGVGGVVLSNLVREVGEMASSRRFFRERPLFTALPVAALVAHLPLVAGIGGRVVIVVALAGYFVGFARELRRADPAPAHAGAPRRRALVHDFLRPRRPRIDPGFQPRREHAALLTMAPSRPPPSALHGLLRGRSVVLLTFESLGAAHIGPGGANVPFLESLLRGPHAVRSAAHCCLAPLTNAAHTALYAGGYGAPAGPWGLLPGLRRAGYATTYLTTTVCAHYGLRDILVRAGFEQIVDGSQLTPDPRDGGKISDHALLGSGLARVRARLGAARPFFLHVHAANTHIPYRVVDRARFGRHLHASDRGRFLNSIEEVDAIFGELWAALRELAGPGDEPLLVVASDHGQAFGEHGYFSHGNAVIAAELDVPLVLHHPALAPRVVPASTHFDVLPTILDLVGAQPQAPGFGASIFHAGARPPGYLLWDGKPSRSTSGCLGLLLGDRKVALDLIRGTCIESDRHDADARALVGDERLYYESLIGLVARRWGI